jgi:hypothetical protein
VGQDISVIVGVADRSKRSMGSLGVFVSYSGLRPQASDLRGSFEERLHLEVHLR